MHQQSLCLILSALLLCSCIKKGPNPQDPYESVNRKIHRFNTVVDNSLLKPTAKVYKAVLPAPVRMGVNNVYNNIDLIPSVANDLLQGDWRYAIKDSWRFFINSTFGIAGIFDPAAQWGLPPHSNDLGITLAKWGDMDSPYIVIPFLGPSTIRDGMGLMFQYALLTPYPYIKDPAIIYPVLGLRYVDLRSQLLDSDRLVNQALDPYSFIRDAYLQHRNYRIKGGLPQDNEPDALYVDEDEVGDYIDDDTDDAVNGSKKTKKS